MGGVPPGKQSKPSSTTMSATRGGGGILSSVDRLPFGHSTDPVRVRHTGVDTQRRPTGDSLPHTDACGVRDARDARERCRSDAGEHAASEQMRPFLRRPPEWGLRT